MEHGGPDTSRRGTAGRDTAETSPPQPPTPHRVVLIGAGNIAETHAAVLAGLPGAELTAVVDPDLARARNLAERFGAVATFPDVNSLLAEGPAVTAAHVLTPPPTHAVAARPLLQAGIDTLVEKPLAETDADCADLEAAARTGGARLSVNQNFIYTPAFHRLAAAVKGGHLGPVRRITCEYSMPLRQLAARQFGHWMFDNARNLLLEQAVHPLSQVMQLLGPERGLAVRAAAPRAVDDGVELIDDWAIELMGDGCSAGVHIALGARHPVWRVRVVCDDGDIEADVLADSLVTTRPTRWIDALDGLVRGTRRGAQEVRASLGNFLGYALATSGLKARRDPFFVSMRDSIRAFYTAGANSEAATSDGGTFGRRLVSLCERIAGEAPRAPVVSARPRLSEHPAETDVVLLGGTGFIGRHTVARLVADGRRVTVVSRTPDRLPSVFHQDRVHVVAGSMADRALLDRLLVNRPVVINLAHGGGSGRAGAERAMVDGATTVADAVRDAGVPHLVHVSSIAALDLGDPASVITNRTPPDAKHERRGDYARAKVLAERALFDMAEANDLPLTVLRPGVVVGPGTSPFHSGVGFFNRETHCIGWNNGRTALPVILVSDVADAIAAVAARPETADGRAYNLVSDIEVSARTYITELGRRTGRPLVFHPSHPLSWQAEELGKWLIKRLAGRHVPAPSLHDFRSRALVARFDISAERRELDWDPERAPERFFDQAFADAL